jgi:hypothetical protein
MTPKQIAEGWISHTVRFSDGRVIHLYPDQATAFIREIALGREVAEILKGMKG